MSNEELVNQIQQGINIKENMATLYNDNKGLIFSIVKRYRYACKSDYNSVPVIEFDELMNEAYFGLVKAVESYEPSYGVMFMSHAPFQIRQAVKRYLENCGQVVRVPVHKQEQIYKYNQVTSYYVKSLNRDPTVEEYASWLGVSVKAIDDLEKFMFRGRIRSLDAPLSNGEEGSITLADAVASNENMEEDVVEKVGNEQLRTDLWELVTQVLKDDKKVQILKWRYIDNLTLEEIAAKYKVTGHNIRQFEVQSLRRLRSNTKTKRIGIELGLWEKDRRISATKIKEVVSKGYLNWLDDKELEYAKRMGWIKEELVFKFM